MSDRPRIPLLRLDPQLGQLMPRTRREAADAALPVQVARLRQGEWDIGNGRCSEHLGVPTYLGAHLDALRGLAEYAVSRNH